MRLSIVHRKVGKKVRAFRDYMEKDMDGLLEGYIVSNVITGINSEDTGILISLEREITGGVIGIDVCYDPTDNEVPLTISDEYIKHVFETDTEDLC